MDMEVFYVSGSPYAWRVLLALEFKKASYTATRLNFSEGENQKPEYLALNPRGKVPTLRDGGMVLPESLAILAYLEKKFPQPPMFGATPEETARIWKVIAASTCYLEPAIARAIIPIFRGQVDENTDDINQAAGVIRDEFSNLEGVLSDQDWLGGDEPTGADLMIYPFVEITLRAAGMEAAKSLDFGLTPFGDVFPALEAWRQRARGLPGFDRVYPPHWKEAA